MQKWVLTQFFPDTSTQDLISWEFPALHEQAQRGHLAGLGHAVLHWCRGRTRGLSELLSCPTTTKTQPFPSTAEDQQPGERHIMAAIAGTSTDRDAPGIHNTTSVKRGKRSSQGAWTGLAQP